MAVEFDPAKDTANLARHGLSLADFSGFDEIPVVVNARRANYGETRELAFGRIGGVGHYVVLRCEAKSCG